MNYAQIKMHGASCITYLSCSESPLVKFLVLGVVTDTIELKCLQNINTRNLITHRENSNRKQIKELPPEDPFEDLQVRIKEWLETLP